MLLNQITLWVSFNIFLIAMLVLDLKVFHRKSHEISLREALLWSGVWILLALIFAAGVYHWMGPVKGIRFLTGYLIEKSLSLDNLFAFLMIFSYFRIPPAYQHKVLFYGIIGALVIRIIFILAGIAIIERFHWTIYLLGALLVYTGARMAFKDDTKIALEKNPVLKLACRFLPVTTRLDGDHFFLKKKGVLHATPLFIVLLVVESTDIMFAMDSIPAILAISTDPFIVYTSNAFAILGLRALYFALESLMRTFRFIKYGLSLILLIVGVKMLISDIIKIPALFILPVILGIIILSIVASLIIKNTEPQDTLK